MRILLSAILIGSLKGAVLCHLHALKPELCTRPHCWESLGKESLIKCVAIVLPQVCAVPCIGNEVVGTPDAHAAKQAALGEYGPALLHTGILLGCLLPVLVAGILDDIVKQRHVQVAQVGRLSGPVVHLNVDVGVYVGVPGSIAHVVPYTLQVVGSHEFAVAGDSQVAAIVEVQLLQETSLGIVQVLQCAVVVNQFVGGTAALGVQVERNTAGVGLEVGYMVRHYMWEALLACSIHTCHHLLAQVLHGYSGHTVLGIWSKVGASSHIHNHLSCTRHLNTLLCSTNLSTTNGNNTHGCLIGYGFQLSVEIGIGQTCCISGIGNRTCIDVLAGHIGEQQVQCLLTGRCVSHRHNLVRIAHQIGALISGVMPAAGKLYATNTLNKVKTAHIVLHLTVLAWLEHSAQVFHEDAAEVLVLAIASAIALHVTGLARP